MDRVTKERFPAYCGAVVRAATRAARARLVHNGDRLLIAEPTGEVDADHPQTATVVRPVLDAHYDGPRPAPSRGPRPKPATEQQFSTLGPAAEAFIVGAAAIGHTRLAAELDVLLSLGAAHSTGHQ